MKPFKTNLFGLCLCLFWTCNLANASETVTPAQRLIETYAAAYNTHDLPTMAALMHVNIEWLSISDTGMETVTANKAELVAELENYFGKLPTSKSTLNDWGVNGDYVSVTETVSWTKEGVSKSQSAITVYQIEDALIRRVWYFPEQY